MTAIIQLLKNTSTNQYHPIVYIINPIFLGVDDFDRYKSLGHRTTGIDNREIAIESIDTELLSPLYLMGYTVSIEVEEDIEWDGMDIPARILIRQKVTK